MNTTPKIKHDQIILTKFEEGDGVLIDVRTKRYYRLNETALAVWHGLQEQQPLAQIAEQLTIDYDVSAAQAHLDVAAILQDFQTRQLVIA